MREDRELIINAMRAMGWEVKRTKPNNVVIWEFHRPIKEGAKIKKDIVYCRQDGLTVSFFTGICMNFGDAEELVNEVKLLKEEWVAEKLTNLLGEQNTDIILEYV